MSNSVSVFNALQKINEIHSAYCTYETTQEQLTKWINKCIKLSITDTLNSRETFKYEECHIEYFKQLLLFSIIKSENDADGYPTGVTYDIAISIKPYLLMFFGTENLPVLNEAVKLLDEDLDEISKELFEDINTWCRNVECVFGSLYNVS